MAGIISAFESGVPEAYVTVNTLVNKRDVMILYSGARTKTAASDYNPTWSDGNLLHLGVEGSALIVLSVFSKSPSAIAEDIFLGQITVDLTAYPQLYNGEGEAHILEFDIPLGHAVHPVWGKNDKEMQVIDIQASGSLRFQLSIPDPSENLYGEFYNVRVNSLGYHDSDSGVKQPMVLCEDMLYLYDHKSQGTLDYLADLKQVRSVKEIPLPMVSHDIPMDGIVLSIVGSDDVETEKRFAHIIDWNRADGELIKRKWRTLLAKHVLTKENAANKGYKQSQNSSL